MSFAEYLFLHLLLPLLNAALLNPILSLNQQSYHNRKTLSMNTILLMILSFCLLTLGVALRYTKYATSFQEYAVGNKPYSTAYLVASLLATQYGIGLLTVRVEIVHQAGARSTVVSFVSLMMAYLFYSFMSWFVSRMGPFMDHLSMGETIGMVYGKYPRIIIALAYVALSTIIVFQQIDLVSYNFKYLTSLDPKIVAMLITVTIILYTTPGGIHAVTITDVIQFITFSITLPMLALWIMMQSGKSLSEMIILPETHKLSQHGLLTSIIGTAIVKCSAMLGTINPAIMQRVYMSKNPQQASKIFHYTGIATLAIDSILFLIAKLIFFTKSTLPTAEIWPATIATMPALLKGWIAICLLAMAMSTADSHLNSCAITVSYDIMDSLRNKKNAYRLQLRLAKITVLAIAGAAFIGNCCYDNLPFLTIVVLRIGCFTPIVTAPFILAILGLPGSPYGAIIGIATGLCTKIAWDQWVEGKDTVTSCIGIVVAITANAIAMLLTHYLKQMIKPKHPLL